MQDPGNDVELTDSHERKREGHCQMAKHFDQHYLVSIGPAVF